MAERANGRQFPVNARPDGPLFRPGIHACARRAQNDSGQPRILAHRHARIPCTHRVAPQRDGRAALGEQPPGHGANFHYRLRGCLRELDAKGQSNPDMRERLTAMLAFVEMLTSLYDQVAQLPTGSVRNLLSAQGKVGKLFPEGRTEDTKGE